MTEEQRTMYSGVIAVRNSDVNLRWSISQLFFLIHSAGFSFAVTRFTQGSAMYSFACIVGFALAVIWWIIARRMQNLINYWNGKLGDLEQSDTQPIQVFIDITL